MTEALVKWVVSRTFGPPKRPCWPSVWRQAKVVAATAV